MKILWAPWRIKYILGKKEGCIFCDKVKENKDRENYVLLRGKNKTGHFLMKKESFQIYFLFRVHNEQYAR